MTSPHKIERRKAYGGMILSEKLSEVWECYEMSISSMYKGVPIRGFGHSGH